jgi:putative tryptophan/tyrosine transport system substrate-binding protein
MLEDITMKCHAIGRLVCLALSLLLVPLASAGQPPGKIYRVGYLAPAQPINAPFREAMRRLGYLEGVNLVIEGRFAGDQPDRLPALAAELVQLPVDVLVTLSTPAALAATRATTTIPIVMAGVSEPVERGLVVSLARPGGNATGVTHNPGPGFSSKQLQLLKDAAPQISRVALLGDMTGALPQFQEVQSGAQALGLTVLSLHVREPAHVDHAFATIIQERVQALFVFPTTQNRLHANRLVDFAIAHGLPTMFGDRRAVELGGLISYWTDWNDVRRRAATYVDKILKGAHPADLPVEQPMTFELVINLKTAQALGLTIPPSLLFQATEVIR